MTRLGKIIGKTGAICATATGILVIIDALSKENRNLEAQVEKQKQLNLEFNKLNDNLNEENQVIRKSEDISIEDKAALLKINQESQQSVDKAMEVTNQPAPNQPGIVTENIKICKDQVESLFDQISKYINEKGVCGESSNQFVSSNIDYLSSNSDSLIHSHSFLQSWAFTNLMGCIFIILCIITITNILFGDYLIEKFQLANKHPLLAKLLKYRGIFKKSSLILNLIGIYLMLIALIIFNIFPFMYS